MKEAIGGTSLFFIVIVILSVFAIYISLSVNWSTAYKVKDEIIFYIEKNKGVNSNTIKEINAYLADVGYFNSGTCPSKNKKWKGYNITQGEKASSNFQYCIIKVNLINNTESSACKMQRDKKTSTTGKCNKDRGMKRSYYGVRTFFLLDLPIIRQLGLTIDGETKVVINPNDFDTVPAYEFSDKKTTKGVWEE